MCIFNVHLICLSPDSESFQPLSLQTSSACSDPFFLLDPSYTYNGAVYITPCVPEILLAPQVA